MVHSLRVAAAVLLLWAPHFVMIILFHSLKGWVLYSENEVINANVLHGLFSTGKHFAEEYWKPEKMLQGERLLGIGKALNATRLTLDRVGIDVFLESSSLIGWLRHGGHIPWETDADLGMLVEDCVRANVTKQAVERAAGNVSEDLVVLKFACRCEEDCEGEDKRLAGKFTDRRTGVTVDIFAYAPPAELRSWQKAERYDGWTWRERVDDDHSDYTFPEDALLPLQQSEFLGSPMLLPRNPREFLSWEYGSCLGTHVWPWRLLLYTPLSDHVALAVLVKSISPFMLCDTNWIASFTASGMLLTAGVFTGFRQGVSLLAYLGICICEFAAALLWPGLLGDEKTEIGSSRSIYLVILLCVVAMIAYDLRGVFEQLFCQFDDFYIHPRRPKIWTLCLLGKCWDFGG